MTRMIERVVASCPFTVTPRQYRLIVVPCLAGMWISCTVLVVYAFR